MIGKLICRKLFILRLNYSVLFFFKFCSPTCACVTKMAARAAICSEMYSLFSFIKKCHFTATEYSNSEEYSITNHLVCLRWIFLGKCKPKINIRTRHGSAQILPKSDECFKTTKSKIFTYRITR